MTRMTATAAALALLTAGCAVEPDAEHAAEIDAMNKAMGELIATGTFDPSGPGTASHGLLVQESADPAADLAVVDRPATPDATLTNTAPFLVPADRTLPEFGQAIPMPTNPAPGIVVVQPLDRPTAAQVQDALRDLAEGATCPPHDLVVGLSIGNELRLMALDRELEPTGRLRAKLSPSATGIGYDAKGRVQTADGRVAARVDGAWYQAAPILTDHMGRFFLDAYRPTSAGDIVATGAEVLGVSYELESGARVALGFSTLCDD